MKNKIKIILIGLFFTLVLMIFVGVGQFGLTIQLAANQIEMHLQGVEKSAQKYMASEEKIGNAHIDFFDTKANYIAYLLREGIIEEDKDVLKEYAGLIGVDAIFLYNIEDGEAADYYLASEDEINVDDFLHNINVIKARANISDNKGVLVVFDDSEGLQLFNRAYGWESGVTNTGIGNHGLTLVCNKDTKEIKYASDKSLIGETVNGIDLDKEIKSCLDEKSEDWQPESGDFYLLLYNVGNETYLGSLADIKHDDQDNRLKFTEGYVFCGFPLKQVVSEYILSGGIYIIVFIVIIIFFILYIFFSEEKRNNDPVYARKLSAFPLLGAFALMCISVFLSQLMLVSSCLLSCRYYAVNSAEMIGNISSTVESAQRVYDKFHLEKCRMAADLLAKQPELKTRKGMKKVSSMLGVQYTNLFDKDGKVVVTDSPYDRFELSENEEDQSYAFRTLLEGNEYLVQEPMKDDTSGNMMQYVGVSVRNEEDLADGFVQIAIEEKELDELYNNIRLSRKLNDIGVGENDFSFVIKDGIVTNSGKKTMIGKKADEIGIEPDKQKDGFSGYLTINDEEYYAAASEAENTGLVYVVLLKEGMPKGQGLVILFASFIMLLCMFIMVRIANKNLEGDQEETDKGTIEDEAVKTVLSSEKQNTKKKGIDTILEKMGIRAGKSNDLFENKSPEGKTLFIAKVVLFLFCIIVVYLFFFGTLDERSESFLMYILKGEWERGINIFAVTASLLIICVITVMIQILERVLKLLSEVSDTKTQTICLLLRSLLQYGAVLSVFYYCLALFGFDTKTLVASAGILSVVVGFGAQKLISDVICGLFLVFENQISVGDKVSIGGWNGTITEIGIRTTKIAFFDDVKSFNNSEITGLINYTTKDEGLIHCEIGVSYEESLKRVAEIFKTELPKIQNNIRGAVDVPYYDGVNRLDDSSIILVFRVRVETHRRKEAMRDFNRELIMLFDRNDIEIPYPRVVVERGGKEIQEEDNKAVSYKGI